MRILFVADGRSPIARNWIDYFLAAPNDYEVHLASTFACTPDPRLASYTFIPLAFSQAKAAHPPLSPLPSGERGPGGKGRPLGGARLVGLRTAIRQWLGPLTLPGAARVLQALARQVQPDLVHAMRIPFEGMLAAQARLQTPLLISIWGNDFTLHAPATSWMGALTRRTLQAAAALHADCRRDVRLAADWGWQAQKPAIVLPGAGGIQTGLFYPPSQPVQAPVIVQPRGFRAYVDNRTFFRALRPVIQARPETRVICPNMAGEAQVLSWLAEWQLTPAVSLLPQQTRPQMADLFRAARVVVSPTTHDGTPNTLLEALACGCLPVAGDLESLREWIIPGANGLLVPPGDPARLAQAIQQALDNDALARQAHQMNPQIITERAAYPQVMAAAAGFYRRLAED